MSSSHEKSADVGTPVDISTLQKECKFYKNKCDSLTFENNVLRNDYRRMMVKSQKERQLLLFKCQTDVKKEKEKLGKLENDLIHMKGMFDSEFQKNLKFEQQISTLKKTLSENIRKFLTQKKEFEKQKKQFQSFFSVGDELTLTTVRSTVEPITPEKPPVKRKRSSNVVKPFNSRVRSSRGKK